MTTLNDDAEARYLLSPSPHLRCVQDSCYYFPDGNALLLVEDTLFKVGSFSVPLINLKEHIGGKVHASFLARESEVFKHLLDPTFNGDSFSASDELVPIDLSGETAFRIPGVKAESFRHFLFMFYGLPSNHGYRGLMGHTNDENPDLINNFHIYLDVAEMAKRLLAPNLGGWAHGQLREVAKSSCGEISRHALRPECEMRAILFAKRTRDEELVINIRNVIQLHYAWVSKCSPLGQPSLNTDARDITRAGLIRIFKHPGLMQIDPALFGFAFCNLLDLGHEVWMKEPLLARDDRVVLLYGQVHLTPLPVSTLGLEWLSTLNVHNQRGEGTPIECCSECNLFCTWEATFGDAYQQQLCATTPPLCGISQLAILPIQRLQFYGALDDFPNCQHSCRDKVMDFVDTRIQDTYIRLAKFCKNVE